MKKSTIYLIITLSTAYIGLFIYQSLLQQISSDPNLTHSELKPILEKLALFPMFRTLLMNFFSGAWLFLESRGKNKLCFLWTILGFAFGFYTIILYYVYNIYNMLNQSNNSNLKE